MYNTTQDYKEKILNDSTQHELNIYIDGSKIDENHIINFKTTLELFNNNEFCLGCTPEIDIEFEIDKRDLPETYNEVYVETGIGEEAVPIGYFTIQKPIEDDEFKVKIKATDYMKKFEDNKYDGSDLNYPAKMLEVLQDICTKVGVELGSTSFLNDDKQIAVYDNTVSARTYLSYIAEQAEGFAVIGRDGKLYIRTFGQDTIEFDINLFKDFKWGDKYKVSRVSYEDGTQNYKFGNETANTVYINQNNMYIVDSEQIENIYNQIKGFEIYSFEGETIIDPAYDLGDVLVIDGKKVLYQGKIEYAGKFKANINSKIQAKTEQESMQTKQSNSNKIKRVQSEINQIDGKILQLAQETTENTEKLTKHEQTIDSISDKVSHIEETTNVIEGNKTISLGNAVAGELIELHIYGNNDVFSSLKISDDVVLSDDLYLLGDSIIVVKDSKENSKEYELGIEDVLRQKEDVYDEYVLKDGKAQIIRRINEDGTIKAKETIEDLGAFSIELFDGTNTLLIKNYTASLKAKFAIQNDMTNIYASKVEMNSAIEQTAEQVDINVNKKLESYSKTTEMNTAIKLVSDNITSEVNKKVDKTEVGTYIQQNAEAVKLAWNQISEFIQMMIINNNASFAILDSNKKVLMSLDKTGQHFYKSDGTTIFGDMGVQKEDNDQYISFSVLTDYNQKISNGMAWGIKTRSDNKFHPIFYIKNFEMAEKASDASYGELVLSSCNILLDGISTGIIGGNIKMYADEVNSAIQFINTDTNTILLSISTQDLESGYAKIKLLDNISVYKNVGGTNSFRLGSGNNYTLIEDDGSISAYGGTIRFGITGREVSFDLYVKNMASIYGNLNVNGNVYANNISSDRRIKDNIKDCDIKALNIINKIQHKQFDKKDDGKHYNIGYIAQDMEEIDPNFIIKREKTDTLEERYYINELPIIATLSKAIQELSQQVEVLQNEVKVLKEEKQ